MPLPICHLKRATTRRIFHGDLLLDPDEGYCPAKDEHYFGFKGGLRIAWNGMIVHRCILPARPHDSQCLTDLLVGTPAGTTVGGNKGFIDRDTQQTVYTDEQICLLTPRRKNMAPDTPFQLHPVGNRVRRLLETVIGQLTERFNIQRLKVRKGWLLLAKWYRKILAHTLCVWLNILNHRDPLDLDGFVTLESCT
jgi:hypothetical protein